MYQIKQLEDNLHQVRQSFNSMVNQINQQLSGLEMVARNIKDQPGEQYPEYNSPEVGQYRGYGSQSQPQRQHTGYSNQNNHQGFSQQANYTTNPSSTYRPTGQHSSQNSPGSQSYSQSNINPISGLSENKSTIEQQSGANRYGAEYSSENDRGK